MRDELFSSINFYEFGQGRKNSVISAIQSCSAEKILQIPIEELISEYEEQFLIAPLKVRSADKYLPDQPREQSTRERVADRSWGELKHYNVDKNYIHFTVNVPFDGDPSLFDISPSSKMTIMGASVRPTVSISGNEIVLSFQIEAKENTDLEGHINTSLRPIETNAERLNADISKLNAELSPLIKQKLEERKKSASQNTSLIQSLTIPIKKRDDLPETYSIPEVQKKPTIVEKRKTKTFTPEPTLAVEEYENILNIIKDVSLAMERSPSTFTKLSEEEIRDFFLIHLNGHYKGSATGETFNGSGKTDILIRHKNANAFIAECKFWLGQKKMTDAIDQLLGYVTWRDTKTSILLFNKKADLTAVVEKAKEVIKKHPNYKSEHQLNSIELEATETISGYKFTHPTDPDKEIFLALMAFQITNPKS